MEDDYNLEDILRDDIESEMTKQIRKCVKIYGLEGCLEKLETLYSNMPELKEKWVYTFWKIVKGY